MDLEWRRAMTVKNQNHYKSFPRSCRAGFFLVLRRGAPSWGYLVEFVVKHVGCTTMGGRNPKCLAHFLRVFTRRTRFAPVLVNTQSAVSYDNLRIKCLMRKSVSVFVFVCLLSGGLEISQKISPRQGQIQKLSCFALAFFWWQNWWQPQASVFGRENTYKMQKRWYLVTHFIRVFTSKVESQSDQNRSKHVKTRIKQVSM